MIRWIADKYNMSKADLSRMFQTTQSTIHYWLKAMRWCDLLAPVYETRTAEAYPVMMTGFFANNFLPAHLGEFVRDVHILARLHQLRTADHIIGAKLHAP